MSLLALKLCQVLNDATTTRMHFSSTNGFNQTPPNLYTNYATGSITTNIFHIILSVFFFFFIILCLLYIACFCVSVCSLFTPFLYMDHVVWNKRTDWLIDWLYYNTTAYIIILFYYIKLLLLSVVTHIPHFVKDKPVGELVCALRWFICLNSHHLRQVTSSVTWL